MIDTMPAVSVVGAARNYLEPLGEMLSERGFLARITRIGEGPNFVEVINRDAPELSESIFAAQVDQEWWFWWSWAERIAPVAEIELAAAKIAYVLASA